MAGELMVAERQGFQKVYDLTERVLPHNVTTRPPTANEFCAYLINQFLEANGLGNAAQIGYLRKGTKAGIRACGQQMLESGKIHEVAVGGQRYWAVADYEERVKKVLSRQRVKILSPFDNTLIQRKRTLDLFDFDYQIECYTPLEKRRYGYFSLPLMWGQSFIGRMDAKMNRKTGVLAVENLSIESEKADEFIHNLKTALDDFLAFNGGSRVKINRISTDNLRFGADRLKRWTDVLEKEA